MSQPLQALLLRFFVLCMMVFSSSSLRAQEQAPNFRERLLEGKRLQRRDLDSAYQYAAATQAIAIRVENRWGELASSILLVQTLTAQGELREARALGEAALPDIVAFDNDTLLADFQSALSETYLNLAFFEESLKLALQSLELYRKQGNRRREIDLYNMIGRVYAHSENHDKAWEYFEQACTMSDSMPTEKADASSYVNLGITAFILRGDVAFARASFMKGLEIDRAQGSEKGVISTLGNIGFLYLKTGALDSAQYYITKTKDEAEAQGFLRIVMNSYNNLGLVAQELGHLDSAIAYQRHALGLSIEQGFREREANYRFDLAHVYELAGQRDSALHQYRQYAYVYKEVFDQSVTNSLLDVEKDYFREKLALENENLRQKEAISALELEASQAESREANLISQGLMVGAVLLLIILIAIFRISRSRKKLNAALQEKNREVTDQKGIIQNSLEEKEVLLREIHHRVKNNLQVVSSLLSLQSTTIEDPSALKAVQEGQHRVKSMALIHKKLYQTDHLTSIDFREYLQQLSDQLCTAYGVEQSTVEVEAERVQLDIDAAVPLGLIVNELLTNAIKYGLPSEAQGAIQIRLSGSDAAGYTLEVSDRGSGLPEGFSLEKSESLGLKLVHLLSRQLKAKVTYAAEQGSCFSIRFQYTRQAA